MMARTKRGAEKRKLRALFQDIDAALFVQLKAAARRPGMSRREIIERALRRELRIIRGTRGVSR